MFVLRHNHLIIGLTLLAIILSFVFIPNLRVKYDMQDFFVEGDPDLEFYEDLRKSFNSEDNTIMIAVGSENGIYNPALLKSLNDLTKKCKELPNVEAVGSITTVKYFKRTPFGVLSFPFLHIEDSSRYRSDSIRIANDSRINGWLVSGDATSATIIIEAEKALDEAAKDSLVTDLDNLVAGFDFPEVHFAGTINYETRYYRMIGREIRFNIILCAIVIVLVLFFIFRSLTGILIPAITVIIAMIILYGFLGVFDKPLDVLSTLFPTIMLVVGTSNLVHIYSKYRDLLGKGKTKIAAITETFKELRITLFFTSLTTAIGFFSLTISSMKPFRNFGFEAGIGVLIAFAVAVTFVPAILNYFDINAIIKGRKADLPIWNKIADKVYFLVTRYPKRIQFITITILVISLFGILMVDTNNFVLSNFSKNSPIRKDFSFFEENFSGVRTFEMAITTKDTLTMRDLEVLQEVEKVHDHLESYPEFAVVYSPITIYRSINRIYEGGRLSDYKLPAKQSTIDKHEKRALKINRDIYYRFIDSAKTRARITARIKDIGSDHIKQLNQKIEAWIYDNTHHSLVEFRNTGAMLLSDKSNDYLLRNMLISLVIAFSCVSLIMLLLFKDLKMVVISLIPNIFPLVFVSAIIGYTGIILNGSVAIIFTIGFVIAVDDTIHFLSKFKLELNKGWSVKEAIHITLRETGKAIIITTIILFFGFIVLLHSDMTGVFYQGLLVSIMLAVALIADLFLLPVLLIRFLEK